MDMLCFDFVVLIILFLCNKYSIKIVVVVVVIIIYCNVIIYIIVFFKTKSGKVVIYLLF